MKNLIENYISKLTIETLDEFGKKNNISLNNNELNYLLNYVKNNINEILVNDTNALKDIEQNIRNEEFIKIKKLYLNYKSKYKGYIF